jgi:hypothetical protein
VDAQHGECGQGGRVGALSMVNVDREDEWATFTGIRRRRHAFEIRVPGSWSMSVVVVT